MIWLLYILTEVIINWYLIEKKKTEPNYLQLTMIRGIAFILYGVLVDVKTYTEIIQLFLYCTASFWLLFDIGINLFRRKHIFYLGTNAKIDNFGRLYPYIYWTIKSTYIILAVYVQNYI